MWQKHDIERLEKAIHYSFTDKELLKVALTHRSAKGAHNERLEFLGDSILGFVIAAELFDLYAKANEGQLTRLRARLVKEKTLADIANEIELGELLKLGSGELKSGGFRRASILSDALEAVFGAIYLDGGLESARSSIQSLYQSRLNSLSLTNAEKDPKTRLQEWLQSRQLSLPNYEVSKEQGKDHNKVYWVTCTVDEQNLRSEGTGTSRRKAEQSAAEKMMRQLDERA